MNSARVPSSWHEKLSKPSRCFSIDQFHGEAGVASEQATWTFGKAARWPQVLRPAVTNILLWYPLIWPQHLWKWFERYGKVTASTPRESAKAHSDGSAMFKDQSFATCHMHNSQDGPYGMACISFNGLIKPPSTWLCTFTSLRVALHSNTSRVALASAAYLPHLSRFCTASICVPCLRDEGGHSHRADHPNWIHVRVAGLGGRFKSALFPNQSCQAKDINNLK